MGIGFLLFAPVVAWDGFCLVTFQQWKGTKDCRGHPGPQGRGWGYEVRATSAEVAVAARQSHLMGGPVPPCTPQASGGILRATGKKLLFCGAASYLMPQKDAAKNMGKQPVWRHLSPAGIPSGYPPSKAVLGDRLGRRQPARRLANVSALRRKDYAAPTRRGFKASI